MRQSLYFLFHNTIANGNIFEDGRGPGPDRYCARGGGAGRKTHHLITPYLQTNIELKTFSCSVESS
jgi:hypothetical protein